MAFTKKIQKCIFFILSLLILTIEIPIIVIGYNAKLVVSDTIIIQS